MRRLYEVDVQGTVLLVGEGRGATVFLEACGVRVVFPQTAVEHLRQLHYNALAGPQKEPKAILSSWTLKGLTGSIRVSETGSGYVMVTLMCPTPDAEKEEVVFLSRDQWGDFSAALSCLPTGEGEG